MRENHQRNQSGDAKGPDERADSAGEVMDIKDGWDSDRRLVILAVLITVVALMVIAAHWPGLSAKAISYNDVQYLTENQLVQNPSWASASRFLTELLNPSTVKGYYQPLAMISLMLDYAMGGRPEDLRQFHRTSLCLHVVNTALIIVLLYLLFGEPWVAAMVGLLFGVHPMTVEPIPWVSERKSLLAAFFVLWCLVSYLWYIRKRNWRVYGISLVMYLLALISKPTSMPVPVLLLLLDYWPIRRLNKRAVLEKIPFFVVGGILAIVAFISQKRGAGAMLPGQYSFVRIPLVLGHNIIFYLYKIIWPVNLSPHYPFPEPLGLSHPMVLIGVIGSFILVVGLLISVRWTPALLTGWLFFFIAILPTMQVVRFSELIAADKYAYLPSIGLLLPLSWFLRRLWNGRRRLRQAGHRQVVLVAAVIVLAGSEAVATRRYLVYWQDTESLWRHMVHLAPRSYNLHRGLAHVLLHSDRVDEAIKECREALRLKPGDFIAHHRLAMAFAIKGETERAIVHYNIALKLEPDYAKAHSDLGVALFQKGEVDQAVRHFRKAVQLMPNWYHGLNNLAWILATQENPKWRSPLEAVRLAERACEITHYKNPEVLDSLAAAYAATGRFDEAVRTAERAIELALSVADKTRADEIRRRLALYQQQRPYCERP